MNKIPDTRVSLILRLAEASDVTAWQEFAEIYTPALLTLVQRRGLQKADAEDVVQEILFGVARSIGRFEPDASRAKFRTWLCRITRNLIADFMEGKGRQPPQSEPHAESALVDRQTSSAQAEIDSEVRASIFRIATRRVKQRVESKTWQAFELTALENQPTEQVARKLGLSPGALYVAKCRVMKAIRLEVQRMLDQEADVAGDRSQMSGSVSKAIRDGGGNDD